MTIDAKKLTNSRWPCTTTLPYLRGKLPLNKINLAVWIWLLATVNSIQRTSSDFQNYVISGFQNFGKYLTPKRNGSAWRFLYKNVLILCKEIITKLIQEYCQISVIIEVLLISVCHVYFLEMFMSTTTYLDTTF